MIVPVLVRMSEARWVNLTFVKTITVEPMPSLAPNHIVVRCVFTDGSTVTSEAFLTLREATSAVEQFLRAAGVRL